MKWHGYGENVWGFTACDGSVRRRRWRSTARSASSGRTPRGASRPSASIDDGTIAPTAAISSIAFAPGDRRSGHAGDARPMGNVRLPAVRFPRLLQSHADVRHAGADGPDREGRRLVRWRLPRHRSRADRGHDREPSLRAGLEDDAEERAHPARIAAGGITGGWLE